MRWVGKVAVVDQPYENTDDGDDFCEHIAEIIEFLF